MKNPFTVLEACVDRRSGKRYRAAEIFDPAPSVTQAKRLVAAGCLAESAIEAAEKAEIEGAAVSRDQLNNDELFDRTVDELKKLADDEKIDLGEATKKADIVAAIRAARGVGA
ncbi:hypothetical protein D5400_12605 [Georhizobium profundi]|uniref:Uncharacterized protein n=1 Tax=Georhizobium profundi TaxID=2341112 RepID=A0A3Q8XPL3_9HYPH|nr:hypothetical protein [Georhizobium profundi]AZN72004.1 hypothetical protein D5400_12605 [Georhizobium profundi]